MEQIDRQLLETAFGTRPEIEDLQQAIELIEEWITELQAEEF